MKTKHAIKSIKLHKAEGHSSDCKPLFFESLGAADTQLAAWAFKRKNDPTDSQLGYDKTDFVITWEDENIYSGRYDLHAFGKVTDEGTTYPNLGKHVIEHCKFYGGYYFDNLDELPEHLTPEDYKGLLQRTDCEVYKQFLENYQLD